MHKTTLLILSVLLLFGSAAFCFQEDEDTKDKLDIGFKAGFSITQEGIGSFNDDYTDNNFVFGTNLRYWFDNNIGIGTEIHFERFTMSTWHESFSDLTTTKTKIPINLNVYYQFKNSGTGLTPYLGGGLTVMYLDNDYSNDGQSISGLPFDSAEAVLGYNIVTGVKYKSFFIEAQYIRAKTDTFFGNSDSLRNHQVGGLHLWFGFRF